MHCRFALAALVILPIACADPCVDDGVNQEKKDNCPGQVDSATEGGSGSSSSAEASATQTESMSDSMTATQGSNSNSMTSDDETDEASQTATEEATADATDTTAEAEGGPGCQNGMLDGDESDVDCGGSCPPCEDGKICHQSPDCQSMMCTPDEICGGGDTCTELIEDNGCQLCIKNNCCDAVLECFMDEFCHCWVECIEQNNDFDPCVDTCMGTMKPGAITSCANSNCNEVGACG
jgi:hypothetical protein